MAVKIRLARRGRKKLALYDVVVADARSPRDGRFIERIGRYNPNTDPATVDLDEDKAFDWVMKGAQPTETVRAMLSYRGIMLKKHLQIGVNKGAISQEDADKKFEAWRVDKEGKIESKREQLAKEAETSAKARKDAETKVKEARAEAIKKKAEAAIAEANAEEAVESTEEATEVADTQDEAPVAEAKEETPSEESAAPKAEAKEEPKEEDAKAEAPKEEVEAKEEAPAKEETPAAEAKEEPKDEAPAKEEEAKAPAKEEPKAEAKEEAKDEEKKEEEENNEKK